MFLRLILFATTAIYSAQESQSLPDHWLGTWAGSLTVLAPDGTTFERAMELTIGRIEGSEAYCCFAVLDLAVSQKGG